MAKKGTACLDPYQCTLCDQVMLLDREAVYKNQDEIVCPYCGEDESLRRLPPNHWQLTARIVLSSDDDDDDDFSPYDG